MLDSLTNGVRCWTSLEMLKIVVGLDSEKLWRAIAQDPIGVRDRLDDVVEGQEFGHASWILEPQRPKSVIEDVVQTLIAREALDSLLAVGTDLEEIELANDDLAELVARTCPM